MAKFKGKPAAELVAEHLGWDIAEVKDSEYQPTRFRSPKVYSIGDGYYCCPTLAQRLPQSEGWNWVAVSGFVHSGRTIYYTSAE